MSRPFKSLVLVLPLFLATVLATTAALDTQDPTGPGADTLRSLQQVRKADQSAGFGRHRMLPSVYSTKVTPAAVGVVETTSTADGRKLQGKPGPDFARMLPSVFSNKATPAAVGVVETTNTAEGRKLQGKQGPDFARKMPFVFPHKSAAEAVGVDTVSLTVNGRRLQGEPGPDFARKMPYVFPHKTAPEAVGVDTVSLSVNGRRLQCKQGPDFARKMAYVFPCKSAAQAVAVDTLSLTVNGRKLSNAFDATVVAGIGPASRSLNAHKGPDFARQLPTTFSSKVTAQPVANRDAFVSASSVALGALYKGRKLSSVPSASNAVHVLGRLLPARNPGHHTDSAGSLKGRKLASFSGAGSVALAHGRLLPTIRNSGTIVDGTPEGVYASGSVSEHIGARSG